LTETYSSLKDAQAADGRRASDKRKGQDPVQYVKGDKQTLGELITWYLKHEEKRDVDIVTKQHRLKPVKKALGDRIIKDIKPEEATTQQGR